jgi:hypothetical protein
MRVVDALVAKYTVEDIRFWLDALSPIGSDCIGHAYEVIERLDAFLEENGAGRWD